MTAILRQESRLLLRGSIVLAGLFAILSTFLLAVFPGMAEQADAIEQAYPEHILVLFGFEELHTIEGFMASYIFPFVWVIFAGIYFAYLGGGLIADDIRSRRMDLTLSNPVSRESVILQKITSLWVPLVVLNGVLFVVLYVGSLVLEESVNPLALMMAHLLSIPYLLVCAAIGLVLSVVLDRPGSAQSSALGVVFLLWLIDGLSELEPNLEWVGDLTPSRYFDPAAILVHEAYPFGDAVILLVAFLALLGIALLIFTRRDI
ncbi:ABC transporter permease [Natronosalvus vescus]|uniref:ABC transporter permease n=1 Tax=Natronosalvus vescus TaxID=2953881 RepID=UPI0020911FA0|nr:ABC transporter permease subunit [Natronosalvus vescus]